jgi:hypothetical protein
MAHCKECSRKISKENHHKPGARDKANKLMREKRLKNGEKYRKRNREWNYQNPHKKMFMHARQRAERLGLEFNLTFDDIVIPEKCPLLGVSFIPGTKGNYEYTTSLDKIDPTKGYTPGNVWVISKKANSMKNNATLEELRTFVENVSKKLLKI